MLRVNESKSAAGAVRYFQEELSRGDYYTEKGNLAGVWHGKAAEYLGLSGGVTPEQFTSLANNLHQETGEQITARMKANRRAGYDFTFSAPKSVSVLYEYLAASGKTAEAGKLLDVFRDAVREAMGEVEENMQARVRGGGKDEDRITGNLAWAEFVHFQSRPVEGYADPHLHTHAYAFNVTRDGGIWKAGQFGQLKAEATYYEAFFDDRLASKLQALGYATERQGLSFELKGIERATLEKYSRRTEQVEKSARDKGIVTDKLKATIGGRTRASKDEGLPPEETRERFYARLSDDEKNTLERIAGGGEPPRGGGMDGKAALDYAIAHWFERKSVVGEKRLLAEALKAAVGSGLSWSIHEEAGKHGELLRGKDDDGRSIVTTRAVLAEENALLIFARKGRGEELSFAEIGARRGIAAHQISREWLSEEQRAVVRHVLQSQDRVIGIRGGAGTGKTSAMQETVAAIKQATGKNVVVVAPTGKASRGVLREDGFKEADTVAALLQNKEMQHSARGGVIYVDEAGLLGAKTLRALFTLAWKLEARIVLQGDTRQHGSVERGDALRLLEERGAVKFAEITKIQRQERADYRSAVAAIAKGDVAGGFDTLERMGAITEVADDKRHAQLAEAYLGTVGRGETALVVAPTHAEGRMVTEAIRDGLKARGVLGEEQAVVQLVGTGWTEAERASVHRYAPGQIVQFMQNGKGFKRGEQATVERTEDGKVWAAGEGKPARTLDIGQAARFQVFEKREIALAVGDIVRITQGGRDAAGARLENGSTYQVRGHDVDGGLLLGTERGRISRKLDASAPLHLAHGYVATSHASQGSTVQHVFIAQGAESFGAANREQFYVSVSRGKRGVHIFTDDKEGLREAVGRTGARVFAVDFRAGKTLEPNAARAPESRLAKVYEFARAYAVRVKVLLADKARREARAEHEVPEMTWVQRVRDRGRGLER